MKAIIYLRISTNNQSLDNQRKVCELEAKKLGIEKVLIFSEIISGDIQIFQRPILMDALLALSKNVFLL